MNETFRLGFFWITIAFQNTCGENSYIFPLKFLFHAYAELSADFTPVLNL